MIVTLHSPLNITLSTITPLTWILNTKSLYDQYVN